MIYSQSKTSIHPRHECYGPWALLGAMDAPERTGLSPAALEGSQDSGAVLVSPEKRHWTRESPSVETGVFLILL